MSKLDDLKNAIAVLEGQDIEELKTALTLVGEEVANPTILSSNTFSGGSKIKIVILQRGWVYVGEFSQQGQKCTLTNASSVRYWGTTKGLGELVAGPTEKTKLDKAGTVTFHELTVVGIIDVEDSKWIGQL